jgi:hypothetical protein
VRWLLFAICVTTGCRGIFGLDSPTLNDGAAAGGDVTIGGTVTGLTGAGLVLQNSGGDDKPITSDGAFVFDTLVPNGSPYAVTVATQPTNPSELCTVTNGGGTAITDVSNVDVTCAPATYTVGGNVAGFASSGNIVLTNNGTDDKTITASGIFTFATPVASGRPYDVQIKSQVGETCSIVSNTGTVGDGPVTTVVVVCGSNLYTVGGTPPAGGVTGLNGSVKLHNGNDTITVNANGGFAFPTPLQGGGTSTYNVTVSQQPSYPPASQTCAVTNGTGTVGTANITNVKVACTTHTFTVGGLVAGLNGTLRLKNGTDVKTITTNGAFTFDMPVASGTTYSVTVSTQPIGQTCSLSFRSGTVTNSDITSIRVTCV